MTLRTSAPADLTTTAPPPRRPANRRALILEAAAQLFTARGFSGVSMGEIAAAVDVGPSALYRHFPGKDDLLAAAVDLALDLLTEELDAAAEATGRAALLSGVAEFAVRHHTAPVLWAREARNLQPDAYAVRSARMDTLRVRFGHLVHDLPEDTEMSAAQQLSARMTFAVLIDPAFHRPSLTPARTVRVTIAAATALLDATVDAVSESPPTAYPRRLRRGTKREEILGAALTIFTERTYARTGMEDVAAAVGLSTSSLYNHFSSKAEILEVAMHRGNGYLQVTLDDILDAATDEGVALRELVDVYTHFALRHAGLVDALVTELRTLGSEAAPLIQAQRDYLGEWVRLGTATAGAERGGHDPAEVRVLVQAIIGAINEVARSHDPLITADLPSAVSALAAAGLGLHQRPAHTSRSTPAASATTRDSMSKTIVARRSGV